MRTMWKQIVVRALALTSACALCGIVSVSSALARADFGIRGGEYTEDEDAFIGAEALFGLGGSHEWYGNPNVEHAFVDNGDLTSASFDFHYDFKQGKDYTVWAGGGPTLLFKNGEAFEVNGNDGTDPGVNLLLGVGAKKGEVRPYGQMKVVVAESSDDTQAVLAGGIRF